MKSEFPFLSAGGVETEEIGRRNGSLVGNVNGWRGWAIGHGDTVSPPLSRPYLANHLSAVMGPVQLSELSQELKPAPARGPAGRQFREDWASAGKAEGGGQLAWVGPLRAWVPPDQQDYHSEHRESLFPGNIFGFGRAGHGRVAQEGKLRQEVSSGSQGSQALPSCARPMN